MTDARTIVFFPEGAYGPTNNCVGIGQVLRANGHRVVFVIEESFAGTLEAKGFEERLMRLGPPPAEPEVPGQFWIDFIRDTAPGLPKAARSSSSASSSRRPGRHSSTARSTSNPRLAEIFDEVAPDVIVEDNVVAFPAIAASGRPWVRIVSCNPMEMKDPAIAPFSSRLPGRGPDRLAGVPRGGPADPRRHVGRLRRVLPRERRDGPLVRGAGPGVHRRVPVPQPVFVPGRGRLRARPAARADVAPPRLHGPGARGDLGAARLTWPSGMGR